MVFLGYHASHEQLPPVAACSPPSRRRSGPASTGRCARTTSLPWGLAQGESGFAWSWLGAALATTSFPIGMVSAPGQRYHPVIAAQALATLAEMFEGRFWCALGSGEALNEHVTGDAWPAKPERQERLVQAADVMRRLIAGERVTHDGAFQVHDARVWCTAAEPGAAARRRRLGGDGGVGRVVGRRRRHGRSRRRDRGADPVGIPGCRRHEVRAPCRCT